MTGSSVRWWQIYLGETQRQALPQSGLLQRCCRLQIRCQFTESVLIYPEGNSFLVLSLSAADCSCQCRVIWWYVFGFLQWKNSTIVNTCISCTGEIWLNTEAKLPLKQKRTVPLSWIYCSALSVTKHVILSLQELLPKAGLFICGFVYFKDPLLLKSLRIS